MRPANAWTAAAALLVAGCRHAPAPKVPSGYPASYAQLQTSAAREGALTIWSAVDSGKAAGLLAGFSRRYPRIRVTYIELSAATLNSRFLAATALGRPTADLLWSSAMDLQIKLVNDGYTQAYASPEARHLPRWANWKNEAWGVTSEPISIIYNRCEIADAAMPRSHAEMTRYLEQRPRDASVAMSDPVSSAVAYLYLSQDQQADYGFWRLAGAMSHAHVRLHGSAEDVLRDVTEGRSAIGYNIVESFARDEARRHPQLGVVLPHDYTLLMSRIAVIPAAARHPSSARLFLDFLLSRPGQVALSSAGIGPIRQDAAPPAAWVGTRVPLRAIRVGPTLLVSQDQLTRDYFLRRWREGETGGAAPTTAAGSGAATARPRTTPNETVAGGSGA